MTRAISAGDSCTNSRRKWRIPALTPCVEVQARFLRFGAEYGVAAADVGHDRMRAPTDITNGDAMLFAGTAAILVARAGGEEAAEDAVLGVEDGQVLVSDGFDPVASDFARESRDLRGVQIDGLA